ncbi:helix-turn-helix domain-containing protein [Oricola sp.]|uniref:helix-turn-helix domain-containing protein n=1 Tax=Oricola sp. TaxID=1979950 RepID=UPI003BAB0BB7
MPELTLGVEELLEANEPVDADATLGADLRALRKARGMTLEDLAQALDRSVGWISQVERDISTPRIRDLQQIARVLDVPLSLFFGSPAATEEERGIIVRANARRVVGVDDSGLMETLLSPDLTDDFEVVHSTFRPGSRREENVRRDTQELAYLVSGRLDVWIDDRPFAIDAGDSFRIRGQNYRWSNPYDQPAIAVWIISPPVY